jgi:hypothetical protein
LATCREAAVSVGDDVLVYFIDMAISQAEQAWAESQAPLPRQEPKNVTSPRQVARPPRASASLIRAGRTLGVFDLQKKLAALETQREGEHDRA